MKKIRNTVTAPTQANLTPMMRQYRAAKEEIPADAILLFRLGDFYEMFFEDAQRASAIMELTLTRRQGIPMCGFPHHALAAHLPRLLAAGVKVAIAEQMEDPKFATGIVKRAVTQIITPGTVIDNNALNPAKNNYLAALLPGKNIWALAALDISTGGFLVAELADVEQAQSELSRLGASECLIPCKLEREFNETGQRPSPRQAMLWTELEDYRFGADAAGETLRKHFNVATLDGMGLRDRPCAVGAAGAVLSYAAENLRKDVRHVGMPELYFLGDAMIIDAISQRNLELVEPLFGGNRKSTLLGVLDQTKTPMGGRLLRNWVLRPLCDAEAILWRQDAVDQLLNDPLTLAELREVLGVVRDIERIVARLTIGSANARDLAALAAGLDVLPGIRLLLGTFSAPLLEQLRADVAEFPELTEKITNAIADAPPLTLSEGGIIRAGYSAELDALRSAATEGKNWLSDIQAREQERSGIKSLKVRYNQVFGYYIEISKANLEHVPEDYVRKQTLVNAERFITPELKELESRILGAEEKAKALEQLLFQELRSYALTFTADLQKSARELANLDALSSLAECARIYSYTRPRITVTDEFSITAGRHPVLDAAMGRGEFIPNDCLLDGDKNRMMILTGPNMAGKSTYIRQTALLAIMAQMGSFIPAEKAIIGLVDRVFTRVGAADDLARGQSTFMVEMIETANILNAATPRSLVILDEIGRGTSTFDGLSIAWAVAEYLHDDPRARCRTQFATHYHELTELAANRRGVNNYNVVVREYNNQVIFMRQIVPGTSDRSYGIHVARLAGLPAAVIERANEVLRRLEAHDGPPRDAMQSLPLTPVRRRKRASAPDDDIDDLFAMPQPL